MNARPILYILDANVLIDAHNKYYAVNMVPEFWDWLIDCAAKGVLGMPLETFEEVRGGSDAKHDLLNEWLLRADVVDVLVLKEDVDPATVGDVIDAYAPDLNDTEIEQLGRDPFLIAYALVDLGNRCVVSNEVSKPSKQRANQKVPDICRKMGVPCCDTFTMLRRLGFRTAWAG